MTENWENLSYEEKQKKLKELNEQLKQEKEAKRKEKVQDLPLKVAKKVKKEKQKGQFFVDAADLIQYPTSAKIRGFCGEYEVKVNENALKNYEKYFD